MCFWLFSMQHLEGILEARLCASSSAIHQEFQCLIPISDVILKGLYPVRSVSLGCRCSASERDSFKFSVVVSTLVLVVCIAYFLKVSWIISHAIKIAVVIDFSNKKFSVKLFSSFRRLALIFQFLIDLPCNINAYKLDFSRKIIYQLPFFHWVDVECFFLKGYYAQTFNLEIFADILVSLSTLDK